MTQKVMTYFFKNDYCLEADVYDKITMHLFLFALSPNWKQVWGEIFLYCNISNQPLPSQNFYLLVGFTNLKYPI